MKLHVIKINKQYSYDEHKKICQDVLKALRKEGIMIFPELEKAIMQHEFDNIDRKKESDITEATYVKFHDSKERLKGAKIKHNSMELQCGCAIHFAKENRAKLCDSHSKFKHVTSYEGDIIFLSCASSIEIELFYEKDQISLHNCFVYFLESRLIPLSFELYSTQHIRILMLSCGCIYVDTYLNNFHIVKRQHKHSLIIVEDNTNQNIIRQTIRQLLEEKDLPEYLRKIIALRCV